jgi:hypothetical protein
MMRLVKNLMLLLILGAIVTACTHTPGGVAPSNTPIEGRKYIVLDRAVETDSLIRVLGFIPISDSNDTEDAINEAIKQHDGDALINITVESYFQWWILFTRDVTKVKGNVIRFE